MAGPTLLERAKSIAGRLNLLTTCGWWAFADDKRCEIATRLEIFEDVTNLLPWVSRAGFELRSASSPEIQTSGEVSSLREVAQWLERPGNALVLTLDFIGQNFAANAQGAALVYERALQVWVARSVGEIALLGVGIFRPIYGKRKPDGGAPTRTGASSALSETERMRLPTPAMQRVFELHDQRLGEILGIFAERYVYLGAQDTRLTPPTAKRRKAGRQGSLSPHLRLSNPHGIVTAFCAPLPSAGEDGDDELRDFFARCRLPQSADLKLANLEPLTELQADVMLSQAYGSDDLSTLQVFRESIEQRALLWRAPQGDGFVSWFAGRTEMYLIYYQPHYAITA